METTCLPDFERYAMIQNLLNTRQVRQVKTSVFGRSMAPFITSGSRITLGPVTCQTPVRIGDVLAVRCPDHRAVIVHRVVGLKENQVLLKGDNTPRADGWFSRTQIVGRVDQVDGSGLMSARSRSFDLPAATASRWGVTAGTLSFQRQLRKTCTAFRRMFKPGITPDVRKADSK